MGINPGAAGGVLVGALVLEDILLFVNILY
jgi:hypothetical protein